jgi:hypothetical protein
MNDIIHEVYFASSIKPGKEAEFIDKYTAPEHDERYITVVKCYQQEDTLFNYALIFNNSKVELLYQLTFGRTPSYVPDDLLDSIAR